MHTLFSMVPNMMFTKMQNYAYEKVVPMGLYYQQAVKFLSMLHLITLEH